MREHTKCCNDEEREHSDRPAAVPHNEASECLRGCQRGARACRADTHGKQVGEHGLDDEDDGLEDVGPLE